MTRPPPLLRFVVRRNSTYLVKAVYQTILHRDADGAGLADYSEELRRTGDLIGVTRSIVSSDEAWCKSLFAKPAKIIEAAFRGLLGRDPEPTALEAYTEYLLEHRDLVGLLSVICRSQEHWEQQVAERAEDIVRTTFLGILKREPDAEALATYANQLRVQKDLLALLTILASSEEHWDNLLRAKRQSVQLLQSDNLPSLLAEVVKSQKVWNDISALKFPSRGPSSSAFESEAWVFVHVQKTGGTSLQNMLADTFGNKNVYREHEDTLYLRSPAELSQYCVFAGHFNFDSLSYIPRRVKRLFAFVREPKQRLMSLYRFLRAHEPTAPVFKGGIEIANQLSADDFFQSILATSASATWNHLTWCVMGQRKWLEYRNALEGADGDSMQAQLDAVRLSVRSRLHEFEFIGFQADFSYSCQCLFELIGARLPHLRHDHSVELLASNLQYFKYVDKQTLTQTLDAVLTPLVQLDNIVYREAMDIYARRYCRTEVAGTFRAV